MMSIKWIEEVEALTSLNGIAVGGNCLYLVLLINGTLRVDLNMY